ncbi:TIGR00303 family protein, partial [Halolamina salina]
MTFVLVAGTTQTAAIDGISAAGETPASMAHTPAADAEILAYGRPVFAPIVPVSPAGCPTPGLVTRAVRDLVDFDLVVADAG